MSYFVLVSIINHTRFQPLDDENNYSRHSLSRILRDLEKNSRQPELELKNRQLKPEVITGSQGMVKITFQERGKGVR